MPGHGYSMGPRDLAAMPIDRHALLHKVFVAMDADRSDYVDAQEFKSIFSELSEKSSDVRMKEIEAVRGRGDRDGRLSAPEFCEFMLEYMADDSDAHFQETIDTWIERLEASKRKLLLRRVFAKMDTDNSGSVSLMEFKQLADDDVGAQNSETFFRWIERCKGDGDGKLTPEEWVPYVLEQEADTSDAQFEKMVSEWLEVLAKKRRVTLLRQVYAKMDADNSGEVDLKEFALLAEDGAAEEHSDEKHTLSQIFHYLDGRGNKDGMLSRDEWVAGMREMGEELSDEAFEEEVAKWVALLTRNQRAIWRSVYAKGHAKRFVNVARAAGATHVLFVHHGNVVAPPNIAGLPADPEAALAAELSNQGTAQCMIARSEWFGRLPVRSVIIASPAKAAQQTAMNMAGRVSPAGDEDHSTPLLVVESLQPATTVPLCATMFDQLGLAPLRKYLDDEGGETAFGQFAEKALEQLSIAFRAKAKTREKATYVAVFGQTVYLNAIAHALACATGATPQLLEPVLDINLGEAEGILVPLYGGPGIQHLVRPL